MVNLMVTSLEYTCRVQIGRVIFTAALCLLRNNIVRPRRQLNHRSTAIKVVLARPCGHLPCFVTLIQVLSRASVIVGLPRCLEYVLLLFGRVLCTKWMSKLHLCIGKYLLLEVADLPLFVAGHALDWSQCAVVLVSRADSHVVKAAVRYSC